MGLSRPEQVTEGLMREVQGFGFSPAGARQPEACGEGSGVVVCVFQKYAWGVF